MKALIDKYLQSNYKEAEKYASYFVGRSNLKIEVEVILSNCYIRYIEINPEIKHEHEAKAFYFHLIKTEILWRDTESKLELITSIEEENQLKDGLIDELNLKIETEERLELQKMAVNKYRKETNDRVKKIFFETYYDKGYNTTRSIAEHFDISSFTAHLMITEMKNEIKDIYELLKHEYN